MKILFIVLDGLGEKPIKELGDKTPLERAKTPNLDYLANNGLSGLLEPCYTMALPTSEEGHFSLFGYSPNIFKIKRGIFTASGAGIKLKRGDVALRGNFGTVDNNLNMIDRRAGRIDKTESLVKSLNGMVIDKVKFLLKTAGGHRVGIVMRGNGLSPNISDGDPHYGKMEERAKRIIPLDKSHEAFFTANVLNKFLEKSHQILKNHPLNEKRKKKGKPAANYILVRGAGSLQNIPSFKKRYNLKASCIAGKILYKQIAKVLGMKLINVKGANGLVSTNLKGKVSAVEKALKSNDFIFLHIKATDSLAEDGNFLGKTKFIEKIDKSIKPFLNLKDILIVVTADHSTCCSLKSHCKELIPVLIFSPKFSKEKFKTAGGAGKDSISGFSEKSCNKGKLGKFKQTDLMKKVLKLAKKN
jgi:2,3-bisphosphoglycerate-independent phosphoglycerate mutase